MKEIVLVFIFIFSLDVFAKNRDIKLRFFSCGIQGAAINAFDDKQAYQLPFSLQLDILVSEDPDTGAFRGKKVTAREEVRSIDIVDIADLQFYKKSLDLRQVGGKYEFHFNYFDGEQFSTLITYLGAFEARFLDFTPLKMDPLLEGEQASIDIIPEKSNSNSIFSLTTHCEEVEEQTNYNYFAYGGYNIEDHNHIKLQEDLIIPSRVKTVYFSNKMDSALNHNLTETYGDYFGVPILEGSGKVTNMFCSFLMKKTMKKERVIEEGYAIEITEKVEIGKVTLRKEIPNFRKKFSNTKAWKTVYKLKSDHVKSLSCYKIVSYIKKKNKLAPVSRKDLREWMDQKLIIIDNK